VTDVTVIGGGLAGMAAALRLAERGCQVSLYEAGDHLGGKASALRNGEDFNEHGFHIFPAWYHNIRQLVEELGIRDHFIDCHNFQQLHAGQFPCFKALHNVGAFKNAWRNLTSGVLPFHQTLLFFFSTVDLASFHLDESRRLDQLSVTGFLRSRFYRTEKIATVYQDLMLKAISVPSHFVSAMTTKKVIHFWAGDPLPMHRILNGNLQERFIDPLTARLLERQVAIYKNHELTRVDISGNRVVGVRFKDKTTGSDVYKQPLDRLVLAIPPERLKDVCNDEVYAASPTLGDVRNLRSRPMAALNLYFTERIAGLPADHVNLIDSKYGLTFIDVAQSWKTADGKPQFEGSVLNVIATDFSQLEGVNDDTATRLIVAELVRFIPTLNPEKIDPKRTKMRPNTDAPLFMNDVGIWYFRPEALPREEVKEKKQQDKANKRTHAVELENLWLAGDYCRSHVDLVSMEGAFTTGLKAAEAVRRSSQELTGTPEIYREPARPRRYPFYALWLLGLPFAFLAWLYAWFKGETVIQTRN
jgi:protoporphyrinogen oxidase